MVKKTTLNTKTFDKEVIDYQNKIFYSIREKCISKSAINNFKLDLSPEEVAYIHSVMVVSDNDLVDYGMGFVDIPVQLLFTMMTPYATEVYDKSGKGGKSVNYMAGVTERCIDKLKFIVFFKDKKKGQCRKFALDKNFVKSYYIAHQAVVLDTVIDNLHEIGDENKLYAMSKAPRGEGFEYVKRLNPITVATVDKLRDSRFVFDAEFYHSQEGKEFIKNQRLENGQIDSLNCALEFLNKYTNSPQYHNSFHLQKAGRMHTVGGCIQLPKWFRDRFILPVNPNNVRVEFDLKCAQLIILCGILNAHSLKEKILEILERDGSIWPSIGDPQMDKRIKKVITYAFCYGGEIKNLPFLASQEARRKNLNIRVNKTDVSQCLNGILQPLVSARQEWLENYTLEKIMKDIHPRKISNSLGHTYSIYQEAAKEGKAHLTTAKLKSTKIGSKLLAHLAQGHEQLHIQNLIANHVTKNILTFQYDGFTLEEEPDKVNELVNRLQGNCKEPMEHTIIEPTKP